MATAVTGTLLPGGFAVGEATARRSPRKGVGQGDDPGQIRADRRPPTEPGSIGCVALQLLVCRLPPPVLFGQLAAGDAALVPADMIPVGAAEFSRSVGLVGPIFNNNNNIGGYLAWAGYPDVGVFHDSRLQAYPPEHFRQIMAYRSQPAWDGLVAGVD